MPLNTGRTDSTLTNTCQLAMYEFEVEVLLLPHSIRGWIGPIADHLPVMTGVHVWLYQKLWAIGVGVQKKPATNQQTLWSPENAHELYERSTTFSDHF